MPFTELQKSQFTALLQAKGWRLSNGIIFSPSGGLWFSASHFDDWDQAQMHEVFSQRAIRMATSKISDWPRTKQENEEAAWAAGKVMRHD